MKKISSKTEEGQNQKTATLSKKKTSRSGLNLSKSESLKLIHQYEAAHLELKTKYEDLLRAWSSDRFAPDRYLEFFDFAPSGYFTLSKEGNILELNLSGAKMLEKERSKLKNTPFDVFVSKDNRPVFKNFLKKVFSSKSKVSCQLTLRPDGESPQYVRISGVASQNRKHCLLTVINFTEHKYAEEKLRQKESWLAAAQAVAKIGSWETDLSDMKVIWSDETYRIFGIDAEAFASSHPDFLEYVHPEDRKKVDQAFKASFKSLSVNSIEHRIITPDGRVKFIEEHWRIFRDKKGKPIRALGTCQDITERKQTEYLQKVYNERLQSIMQSANDAIISANRKGIITGWNRAAEKIFGYSEKEIMGKDLSILMPPQYTSRYDAGVKWIEQGNAHHIPGRTLELYGLHKNGKEFPVELSLSQWETAGGKFYTGFIRDISFRKKAEEELEEKEFFLRESQKAGKVGSYKTDFVSGFWQSSESLDIIFGIDKSYNRSIAGWLDIVHPDDKQTMDDYLRTEVIGRQQSFNREYRIIRMNDKQVRWVHGIGEVKFDSSGNILIMIGTIQDITKRKKEQEKLVQLSLAMEQSPATVVITDPKGNIQYINPKFTKTTGYTPEETIGKNPRILKSGHTPDEEYKELWQTISSGGEWRGEFSNKKKNGEIYWESALIAPIKNEKGEIINYIATKEDITERKLIEESLIRSEMKFRSLFDTTSDAVMLLNEKGFLDCNQAGLRIFGCKTKEEFLSKKPSDLSPPEQFRGADSMTLSNLNISMALEEGENHFEWICKRVDNKLLFPADILLSRVILDGKPALQAVVRDITERKNAEEKLRTQNKMLLEIASMQSHQVRGPLSSILGLISLINFKDPGNAANIEVLAKLQVSTQAFDKVIHDIVNKTHEIRKSGLKKSSRE